MRRPRGPVDTRVFALVPALRRSALGIGVVSALGSLALIGQVLSAAWAVTSIAATDRIPVWAPVFALVLLTALRAGLHAAEQALTARAAGSARVELTAALTDAGLALPPGRATGPGAIAALATTGVDTLETYVTRYLPAVVPAVLLPPVVIVLLLLLDLRSGVVVACTLPLVPVFAVLVGWLTRERSDQQWRALSGLSSHFLDVVQGLVTLRAHGRAERQVDVLTEVGERHRAATVRVLRIAFLSGTALDLVATVSVGLVAVEAGLRVAAGHLGLGTAMIAILVAPQAYRPVRELGARFHESADAVAVLDDVTAVLQARPGEVQEPAEAVLPAGVAMIAEGVGVRLPGRAEPVLHGVGLWVLRGQITAITGRSGVGKTTLLRVLAGRVAPDNGSLRRDRAVAPAVYLPQSPAFPLALTLGEAVRAGWPQAPAAAVEAALRDAAATDWIAGLAAGLDTPLGEDGRDLSAGQRQRLALARTYLQAARPDPQSRSRILLLDEPTAHLDEATEREVLAGLLRRAEAGCSVVTVAHRPAAIAAADEVMQLGVPVVPAAETGTAAGTAAEAGRVADAETAADAEGVVGTGAGGAAGVRLGRPGTSADPAGRPGWWARRSTRGSMNSAVLLGTGSALSGVALTAVAAWLLTRASSQPPILTLTVAVVGVRLFALARPLLSYLDRLVAHDAALAGLGRLRAEVYAGLIDRVPGPAVPRRGDLLTRLVDDVDAVADIELRWRRPVLVTAGTVVVAVAGGFAIAAGPTLAAVPGLLLAALVAPGVAGLGAVRRTEQVTRARADQAQAVVEVLAGTEDVHALGTRAAGVEPVMATARNAVRAARLQIRRQTLAEVLRTVGTGLAVAGAAAVATAAVGSGGTALEQAGVIVLGVLALGDETATLPDAVAARTRGRIAKARLEQILAAARPSNDPAPKSARNQQDSVPVVSGESERSGAQAMSGGSAVDAESAAESDAEIEPAERPGVRLSAVVAGWEPQRAPVLTGADLDLTPGRRVAVQGPSGCGKSTLAAVVVKFLDPRAGSVRLGVHDYRELTGRQVRSRVGLVPDDDHVFAGTVRANLALARPEAGDGDLLEAMERVRLGDWLAALPEGLDTWLGERGTTMSAGERRRLALARALLADRPVLVLDEPAESLDRETARAVLADLLAGSPDRSVLLVTHRDEGLDAMDEVLRPVAGRLTADS